MSMNNQHDVTQRTTTGNLQFRLRLWRMTACGVAALGALVMRPDVRSALATEGGVPDLASRVAVLESELAALRVKQSQDVAALTADYTSQIVAAQTDYNSKFLAVVADYNSQIAAIQDDYNTKINDLTLTVDEHEVRISTLESFLP